MMEQAVMSSQSLPLEFEQQVDQLCDEFEDALKSGRIPNFDEYITRLPAKAHRHLLRELTKLLRDYVALPHLNGNATTSGTTVAQPVAGPNPPKGNGDLGESTKVYLRQSLKVLQQNDDYGRDYFDGFKEGLGKETSRIVRTVTYEATDPTVDSQIIQLKDSGANVFFNVAGAKAAAQGIRKAADIAWKPIQYLNNVSASVAAVMKPAGFDNAQGIITASYLKDSTDKQWDNDDEMKAWRAWMDKWMPGANKADANHLYGYAVTMLMCETLKKCGNDLTRANVMKQAANFQKYRLALLLPGILINTSPTDYYPIQAVQLQRFKGDTWELFGEVMHAEGS